ncbi:MAG: 50S ribosomal protein L35, partial [Candidatus Kuenenia stuttgartiensis]|nr:50S ribosomal protein L35 [Candidatus Kuenenia stuttgartiensis]
MPKLKPHKGLKKRVKITANGKVMRSKAGKSHLMSGKSGRRKQRLRKK